MWFSDNFQVARKLLNLNRLISSKSIDESDTGGSSDSLQHHSNDRSIGIERAA